MDTTSSCAGYNSPSSRTVKIMPTARAVFLGKAANVGMVLGSGLLLAALSALSRSAAGWGCATLCASLSLKYAISKINDLVHEKLPEDTIVTARVRLASAARKGQRLWFNLLLYLGASLQTPSGHPSLLYEAVQGCRHYKNEPIVKDLLRIGAAVDQSDFIAALDIPDNPYADEAALLLLPKVDKNGLGDPYSSILYKVAEAGKIKVARALIEAGAAVDALEEIDHSTPLFGAINKVHPAMVELLIRAGSNLEREDVYGRTPLRVAKNLLAGLETHHVTLGVKGAFQAGDDSRPNSLLRVEMEKIIDLLTPSKVS